MKTTAETGAKLAKHVSVEVGKKGYQAKVKAGNHEFMADEPVAMGGTDSGPNPEELILSALGSCTAITLRMYADRKNLPVEKIEVKLRYGIGNPEQTNKPINTEILLHGNLTAEQVTRIGEIAEKCPVHKSLLPAYAITTKVELAAPEFQ